MSITIKDDHLYDAANCIHRWTRDAINEDDKRIVRDMQGWLIGAEMIFKALGIKDMSMMCLRGQQAVVSQQREVKK